jgi:hypothetical protein
MITMTRSLARHLRAVVRRAGFKPRSGSSPPLSLQAGPAGLRIRLTNPAVAIEYLAPGAYPIEDLTVALALLDDCQGKQDEPVTLESGKKKKTIASWRDSGVPQLIEYDAEPVKKPFPELPETFTAVEPAFWQAMHDAAECTDQNPTRFALNNILLRADGGQVFASDGRQIYLHTGFQFPWTGDVMVPALAVLGCADLASERIIEIGKTEQSFALRIGNWTIVLESEAAGRFPDINQIVAGAEAGTSLLRIPPSDAQFLSGALPRLTRDNYEFHGVTLDLNGQAVLRAKAAPDAPMTEVFLSNSATAGPPMRMATDRSYLLRALRLGLTELRFTEPHLAVLATDERRKYIWMPLSPEGALAPAKDAIRIDSPLAGAEVSQTQSQSTRRRSTMSTTSMTPAAATTESAALTSAEPLTSTESASSSTPPVNGAPASNGKAPTNGPTRRTRVGKAGRAATTGAIEQAVALRDALRASVAKTNELIRSLKRQRQQSRLVQTTLASLKQLQQAG